MKTQTCNHNCGLCRWCVEPVPGNYIVSHHDFWQGLVTDYACEVCADGWCDIANPNLDLIV